VSAQAATTSGVATMAAAVIAAPRTVELVRSEVPRPKGGEVLIRIEGCGLCSSSLPLWEGREWFRYPVGPGTPGHEGWGRIAGSGDSEEGPREGARVAFLSDRAFAEYAVVDRDHLIVLPPELDGIPFPGEAFACGINIFRRSDIRPDQTVAVVGIGFLGALVTRLASSRGARVIGISRRASSLDLARRCGAAATLAAGDRAAVVEEVMEMTGGRGCDRVVEAAGVQDTLDLASELTRERSRLVVAGYHQDGPRRVDMQMWNWRGLDVVNAHERDPRVYVEGMRIAVEEILAGSIDPRVLVTHEYGLENLGVAMDALRDRPEGFVKGVVRM
jgi:threonine dehydrogenase-like Zn-dependent dehydrogenase